MTTPSNGRGHELVAHTADEILEAWGPTREACLEEAVLGLVAGVAEVERDRWWWHRRVDLRGDDDDLLVALLEEVIYHLDVDGGVPVHVRVHPRDGGVVADLWLTDLHRVTTTGAAPKGVSYSRLVFGQVAPDRWRCRVTVDV
jgi:SHS2 domain-containing protein